jgi:transcriptional regulator with GAF, ATPase, and Fis domain
MSQPQPPDPDAFTSPQTSVAGDGRSRSVNLSQCKLVVVKGAQRGREYVISGDVIRIGKVEGNDVVLPEETVSRVHAEILRDAKGYLLRDLHSTNGTFLDGAEIREAYIRAGSVITVGTVQLKFQPYEERIEILPSEKDALGELVGGSLRMREIFGLVERIAPTEATVLIEGETGTGKDLVARTIHSLSRRAKGPFIVVDCGAVAGALIESELFGHEKGAFTGAATTRLGAFELASANGGGTIFLDELGELSLELQPKLLRVLEQREIRRVGGNRTIKVDIRVIAATKRDLAREVQQGKFREDLFFRLSVVPIRVPSLRERKEDLPLLVRSFLHRMHAASESSAAPRELDESAMASILAHDWPGNVRELRNVLERGVYLAPGAQPVRLVSLPGQEDGIETIGPPLAAPAAPGAPAFDSSLSYRGNKERWENDFERRYLTWLMDRAQGNISRAAREADMDRKYLHKLLKKHNIVV